MGFAGQLRGIRQLKQSLIARGEATELFAQLRDDGLTSILGNLDQSAFGKPAYPTIESKAAHLLYFIRGAERERGQVFHRDKFVTMKDLTPLAVSNKLQYGLLSLEVFWLERVMEIQESHIYGVD